MTIVVDMATLVEKLINLQVAVLMFGGVPRMVEGVANVVEAVEGVEMIGGAFLKEGTRAALAFRNESRASMSELIYC